MHKSIDKIGILTYTSNFNFGTFFQAYATLCSIRGLYSESCVEIINCQSESKFRTAGYGTLNLKKKHLRPSHFLRHLRKIMAYRKLEKEFLSLDASKACITDSYNTLVDYIIEQSYDLVIVGSDTVLNFYGWNLEKGELPVYWLPSRVRALKVMVASSVGTDLEYARLDSATRESLAASIEGFTLMGVRDPMTVRFIQGISPESSERIRLVPDPTISLALDSTCCERYLERRKIDASIKLIGLDLPPCIPGLDEALMQYKKFGYRVVSWRGRSRFVDYDFSDMNGLEWAGMFSRYSITLTNRFHASIFSLKNFTPVIAIDHKRDRVTEQLESKVSLLLEDFGLKASCYRSVTDISDRSWLTRTIDLLVGAPPIEQIQRGLSALNVRYLAYLREMKEVLENEL